jgi:AcrR family transcriptional regulator
VRDAAWNYRDPAGAEVPLFLAIDMEQYLTLEQVKRLIGVRVSVQRRYLARIEVVLKYQERSSGFLFGGFPGVHSASTEPSLLAFAALSHRDRRRCHAGLFRVWDLDPMKVLRYRVLMSTPYERSGRTQQKLRTRNELIAAARTLIAQGGAAPTVEEAAVAASISRTTAYRYFPNQQALLLAAHPETEATSLLPPDAGDSVEDRLRVVLRGFTDLIVETEQQQRTMLRLSLTGHQGAAELPLRQGRAIGWFEDALATLRPQLTAAAVRRLAVAIRSAVGIESLVWLTDVAGLSRDEAAELMQWSGLALLGYALTHGPPLP